MYTVILSNKKKSIELECLSLGKEEFWCVGTTLWVFFNPCWCYYVYIWFNLLLSLLTDGCECCCCVRWRSEEGTQAMRVRVADCVIHQHGRRGDCVSAADSSRQRLLELPHQRLHHQPARQHRRHDGGESLSITGRENLEKASNLLKCNWAMLNMYMSKFTTRNYLI